MSPSKEDQPPGAHTMHLLHLDILQSPQGAGTLSTNSQHRWRIQGTKAEVVTTPLPNDATSDAQRYPVLQIIAPACSGHIRSSSSSATILQVIPPFTISAFRPLPPILCSYLCCISAPTSSPSSITRPSPTSPHFTIEEVSNGGILHAYLRQEPFFQVQEQ